MRKQKFTRPISVYLHEDVFQQIKTISDVAEISLAEWIRSAIDNALTAEERGA